ncbi:tail fiber protein [Piscinibacter sp. XHJ-5]|uniref:phage tail protein n=1 Tax=Piscinibacter sp. XHJ-5 TaxID=3037797 RepID=UPI002452A3EF|nr:tail fiber protein [Piscinibacter sp. XHJ-5]
MTVFRPRRLAAVVLACACLPSAGPALAQTSPYLGQIMCGAWNFAPRGWAMMNGQLLPIAQNTALFSLLGNSYGGDGQVSFALPDLRGRVPLHIGQGLGLTARNLGDRGGSESVNLTAAQLPPHAHAMTMLGSGNDATSASPAGRVPAKGKTAQYADPSGLVAMSAGTTGSVGSAAAIDKMPPYLAVNCVIALQGTFPTHD